MVIDIDGIKEHPSGCRHWPPERRTGPAHRPVFTATVSAVLAAEATTVAAEAQGPNKNDAKTAAAQAFLDRLLATVEAHRVI